MKLIAIAITMMMVISGCVTIPDSAMNAISTAGGGYAEAEGIWGRVKVMTGGAEKGSLRNGEVSVSKDAVIVRDAATVRAVPPVPGTVTTITVPGTSTTTVAPAAKP